MRGSLSKRDILVHSTLEPAELGLIRLDMCAKFDDTKEEVYRHTLLRSGWTQGDIGEELSRFLTNLVKLVGCKSIPIGEIKLLKVCENKIK